MRSPFAALWAMLLLYGVARVLQLYSGVVPTLLIVIMHVTPPAAFGLIHASRIYRWKGGLVFADLSMGIGFVFESLSLRTGFPFGHYHFTEVMGPKVFEVPVLLALAYVGMGYVAWVLALIIGSQTEGRLEGARLVAVPMIASFIMAAWDLSQEPDWATVDKAWIWEDGGPYFGVPISNFVGWYLTAYVFYQLFAVYVGERDVPHQPAIYWRLPIMFYALSACGNLLLAIPATTAFQFGPNVADATGRMWKVSSILEACAVVSLFVMLPIAAWAGLQLERFQGHRNVGRVP